MPHIDTGRLVSDPIGLLWCAKAEFFMVGLVAPSGAIGGTRPGLRPQLRRCARG
jgi:hypothetical protein